MAARAVAFTLRIRLTKCDYMSTFFSVPLYENCFERPLWHEQKLV